MEDKANQALEQLLDRAISGVDRAVDFSQAQIPDVVEQLLLWHMVESAAYSVLFPASSIMLFVYLAKRLPRVEHGRSIDGDGMSPWEPNEWFGREGFPTINMWTSVIFPFLLMIFMSVVTVATFSFDWLQILIAPKLYLLEYAADLVK